MKWKVRTLVMMGLLVALSVLLTRFSIMATPTIRIGFRDVPLLLAGMLFGPLAGAITGVAADLIGFLVSSSGSFFPGFTLSAALVGFIPGLFFMNRDKQNYSLVRIILSIVVVEVIVSLVLNTFWLTIMVGKAYWVLLPPRAITRMIITTLEILIVTVVVRALHKSGVVQ